MNVVVETPFSEPAVLEAPVGLGAPVGPEVIAWPIAPGALLFVGRTTQSVPASGYAQLEDRRADRGPFRAFSWAIGEAQGLNAFVAAVRLSIGSYVLPGQTLLLIGSAPNDFRAGPLETGAMELRLPAAMGTSEDFLGAAGALLEGAHAAAGAGLARFLIATFPPSAMRRVPAIGTMLETLLSGLSVDDGCIELMGAVPGACGFLQGWGGPIDADRQAADGSLEALLAGDRVVRARVRVATFARPDIVPPSTGMVLVVSDANGLALDSATQAAFPGLEHVYLLTRNGVLRRSVVEPRLLNPADSSGHIRDMLPTLSCPPRAADCLRLALKPRYAGRETFTEHKRPVRAAIDHALLLPPMGRQPGGIYLCGWLFDPLRLVVEVTLRSSAAVGGEGGETAFAARLDTGWTRVERADVGDALLKDGFPPPNNDLHGFAVYAQMNGRIGGSFYLDVAFRDGTCAFLPVVTDDAADPIARTRVLEGTDLHKPSGISVIERQLGPFFLAHMRRGLIRQFDDAVEPQIAVAVVIALVGPPVQPRAVLSQFLHDPLQPDERLVFVCGAAWGDATIATLRRVLAFMALHASVLLAPDAVDLSAALDVAACEVAATHYLLLDPATRGAGPGWRGALREAVATASRLSVACPTLLYEDLSIRFAGAASLAILPFAPYAEVTRQMAGMPAAFACSAAAPDKRPSVETRFGTLACCLVPRAALQAIGAAQTALAGTFGQDTGLFLRLHAAGIACLWVPQAVVYAPDVAEPTERFSNVSRLIDGWCLREMQRQ